MTGGRGRREGMRAWMSLDSLEKDTMKRTFATALFKVGHLMLLEPALVF